MKIQHCLTLQQGGGLVEKSKLLIGEKGAQPAEQALLARTLKLDLPAVADYGAAWDEAIRSGNIAGLFAPTWFQGYISNIYSNLVGKWRSIPPSGRAFLDGAQYFGIPTKSTNQEAAWAFVKYCCAGVEGRIRCCAHRAISRHCAQPGSIRSTMRR